MRPMLNLILVGVGGFFGAISRYGVSQLFPDTKLHFGTLAVNLIGCLLIGIAFGFLSREAITRPAYLILVTGFLGGFTTFSAFGLDTLKMIHDGAVADALLYVAVSVLAGAVLVAAGYELVK